jgi:hypothetical protein
MLTMVKAEMSLEIIPTSATTIYVKVKQIEAFRVSYHGSMHFELLNRLDDPNHGTWVARRKYSPGFFSNNEHWNDWESFYFYRDNSSSMTDRPSSAASKKIKAVLTEMVNIWAVANPGLLIEGERKNITDDIERAERKRDELLAELNEVDKTLAGLTERLKGVPNADTDGLGTDRA